MRYPPAHQCYDCGRFSKYEELDYYAPFGCSSYDPPEPHDPRPICKKCSSKLKQEFIKRFKEGYRKGDWQKSNAECEAAEECGLVWIHNTPTVEYNGKTYFCEYIEKDIYNKIKDGAHKN